MGAPLSFARDAQVWAGRVHLEATIEALEAYEFSRVRGTSLIVKEPIGVAALITPWNWPLNQIVCKVAPALAAGCTVVLKPSEIAPFSGIVFAEIVEAADAPRGVFNLVNGTGPDVGQVMASHPGVDMVSFTGSTRAGVIVAKDGRRHGQAGGARARRQVAQHHSARRGFRAGRSRGRSRLFLQQRAVLRRADAHAWSPPDRQDEALAVAKDVAEGLKVGDPREPGVDLGPVVSRTQFDKIQRLIEAGISEGARLVAGGPGRPPGLNRGYYVRPTVFGDVKPGMTIEREEVFGPVLAVIGYRDEEEAVRIANDTVYGLAAYVSSADIDHARAIAARLRAGTVNLNYPAWDVHAPVRRIQTVGQRARIRGFRHRRLSRTQGCGGLLLGRRAGASISSRYSPVENKDTGMFTLDELAETIARRAGASADQSYTRSLLDSGPAHCARKFGEEAIEFTIAAAAQDENAVRAEAADVLYHLLVVLQARGVPFASVMSELRGRTRQSGHEEKTSRKT